jgi:hypothetical protein
MAQAAINCSIAQRPQFLRVSAIVRLRRSCLCIPSAKNARVGLTTKPSSSYSKSMPRSALFSVFRVRSACHYSELGYWETADSSARELPVAEQPVAVDAPHAART